MQVGSWVDNLSVIPGHHTSLIRWADGSLVLRACIHPQTGYNAAPLGAAVKPRTRTLTVVFTDMVDYTRSVAQMDREGLRNLLALHEQRVEPILKGRGGRIVKNIGDSFMALFDSATDAVRACLDLVEANPPGDGAECTFRAGAATGDVEEIGGDAFGDPCNLAARVIGRTPAGEVWFAASTLMCMNQAEIPWESVGRFALKGLPGETEVFRAVPLHAAVLPEVLIRAAQQRLVVRWAAGEPPPQVPPNGYVVMEGFRPGSSYLQQSLELLPVLDPAHTWLSTYNLSPLDRHEWLRAGRGLVIATPVALRAALEKHARPVRKAGADTLIMDVADTACELVMGGLALPAISSQVPLQDVVSGYSYFLASDGRWLNANDRALARVDVDSSRALLTVLAPGVTVGGRSAAVGTAYTLEEGLALGALDLRLSYHSLGREGYLGVLLGETQLRVGLVPGGTVELGREPGHPGLLLPTRNNQDNIRWCNGPRASRAKEKGFTLDNVLTGRRHAFITVTADGVMVQSIHENCPTVLWQGDALTRLVAPAPAAAAQHGARLLLGSSVVLIKPGSQ